MKRSVIVVAAFAGLLMGCGVDTFAPPTGGLGRFILRGKVTNLTGTALQNVTVQVQPLGGGTVIRTMLTDATGTYRTFGLAAGIYRVAVVMGDSSIITATGRKDTVYVGASADSTILGNITYDPGKIVSGSLTYSVQTPNGLISVPLRNVRVRLRRRTVVGPPETYVQVDSIRTSATGAYRFAIRIQASPGNVFQLQFDTSSTDTTNDGATVFPSGFTAALDSTINVANIVDTLRTTPVFLANVTTATSASMTFRAPYTIRARIFKDRSGDGIYRALATDPDTLVSGVRIWLRTAGSTVNLGGSSTAATATSAAIPTAAGALLPGNISLIGLKNEPNWTLHVVRWYLPTGCTFSAAFAATMTAEGDIPVTNDLAPLTTTAQVVPTLDIPLTCP